MQVHLDFRLVWKQAARAVSILLCAALLIVSPGLDAYQAVAQSTDFTAASGKLLESSPRVVQLNSPISSGDSALQMPLGGLAGDTTSSRPGWLNRIVRVAGGFRPRSLQTDGSATSREFLNPKSSSALGFFEKMFLVLRPQPVSNPASRAASETRPAVGDQLTRLADELENLRSADAHISLDQARAGADFAWQHDGKLNINDVIEGSNESALRILPVDAHLKPVVRLNKSFPAAAMRISKLGLTQSAHENIVNPIIRWAFNSGKIELLRPGTPQYNFFDPNEAYLKNKTQVYLVLITQTEFQALAQKKAKESGITPPLDIVVHPGRKGNSVYYFSFQSHLLDRLSPADRAKISLHEVAHIKNPEMSEDDIQEKAGLPDVPNVMTAWISKLNPRAAKIFSIATAPVILSLNFFLQLRFMFRTDDAVREILEKYKWRKRALTTLFIADAALIILLGLFSGRLIDVARNGMGLTNPASRFYFALATTFGINFIYFWVEHLHSLMSSGGVVRITNDLRKMLFEKLTSFDSSFFRRHKATSLAPRLTEDPAQLTDKNFRIPAALPHYLFLLIFSVTMMLWTDWHKALIVVSSLPLFSWMTAKFALLFGRFDKEYSKKRSEVSSYVSDMLSIIEALKVFGIEHIAAKHLNSAVEELQVIGVRRASAMSWYHPLLSSLSDFSTKFLILLLCSWTLFFHGYPTLGTLVAMQSFAAAYQMSISGLSQRQAEYGQDVGGSAFVLELLDRQPDIQDAPDAVDMGPIQGDIELDHVMIKYGDNIALEDVSLKISKGQWVGIVGRTASGKSTLLSAITRLVDPASGRVLIDGRDIRKIRRKSLTGQFAIAPQGGGLFRGTIRQNLVAVRPDATEEQVRDAVTVAQAQFVLEDPEGLERDITTLSGGQKQRVALARLILRDPRIPFFDEATSELDEITQAQVQKAVRERFKGRTMITVAHRLSTIKDADIIYVVDQGRIVELGKHEELLSKKDFYYRLWTAKDAP